MGDADGNYPSAGYPGGYPGGMGGMGGMRGMGGMGGMGGISEEERESFQRIGRVVDYIIKFLEYGFYAICAFFVFVFCYRIVLETPVMVAWVRRAAKRKRSGFEKATALAIASVALPIFVAQLGLLAGPLLQPVVGWKIYVYGSATSGAAAAILGAYALRFSDVSLKTRATVATVTGVVVLLLVYASTRVSVEHKGLPKLNDFSTDVDDAPRFVLLADANHTGGYPAKWVPRMREYFEDVLVPKTTSLPIGAAFIRALHLAEEFHWTVVTPIEYTDGHVAPHEWMDKEEVGFEATSTALSPVFRIPDEIVVRVRKYTFDDGYVGARVDIRSRGHTLLPNDRGTNLRRVRAFVGSDTW